MNKKWKHQLQSAFEAPAPKEKEKFLHSLNVPKLTYRHFFVSQIAYIRKYVWCCSLLPIVILMMLPAVQNLIFTKNSELSLVWTIASVLPFIALISVTELSRSLFYNMAELEMSCRYSFSSVVITRAAILGISNSCLLVILLTMLHNSVPIGILRLGIYLLVPYLLTCTVSFLILNHIRGRENVYYCGAAACAISIANELLSITKKFLYADEFLSNWFLLGAVCIILILMQWNKFTKKTEEMKWNLLSTD